MRLLCFFLTGLDVWQNFELRRQSFGQRLSAGVGDRGAVAGFGKDGGTIDASEKTFVDLELQF
jgi:hypothetical protein